MIVMTSTKVRQNFGEFLDKGSREIIIVKRQNREVGAFIPMADLEKLRKFKARDIEAIAVSMSEEATRNGMSERLLDDILAEVNPS